MIPLDDLHPLLVHFPIALFGLVWLFDVLSVVLQDERFEFASFWTLIMALLATVGTIITGFIADQMEGHMDQFWLVFKTHGSMQLLSSINLICLAVWRFRIHGKIPGNIAMKRIYFGLLTIAVLGIYYGSHLGAKLAGRI